MTQPLPHLHRQIIDAYDENELRTLAFDLAVPYDALPGQGTAAIARELILYLGRRRRFDELLAALQGSRPGTFDDVEVDELYAGLPAWEKAAEQARQQAEGEHVWWKPSDWEEIIILLAGMKSDASGLLDRLAEISPMVASCLPEENAQASESTKENIVEDLLMTMTDERWPFVARAQAGQALAQLGDPRPGVGLGADGLPDIVWCEVPAGRFVMGEGRERHEVTLPTYRIAKYPVTNSQFHAFVDAGGYREQHYWHEAKESGHLQDVRFRNNERLYNPVPSRPNYYLTFNLPNHPAVRVSWYECVAYCRWLTEVWHEKGLIDLGEIVRLPSEAEWEKAARGDDGRLYPWGNQWEKGCCNSSGAGIRSTCAVGMFPKGKSPYGCHDIAGNAWEWTLSQRRDYPYQAEDGREELTSDNAFRGLRGGAYCEGSDFVRCAFRLHDRPYNYSKSLGMRVVVSQNVEKE